MLWFDVILELDTTWTGSYKSVALEIRIGLMNYGRTKTVNNLICKIKTFVLL
jgi:hypothetical protein